MYVALSCPSLSNPANGHVALSSGLAMGSTATYTCDDGYRASYTSTRYCQTDAQWSGEEPSCIRKCLWPFIAEYEKRLNLKSGNYINKQKYIWIVAHSIRQREHQDHVKARWYDRLDISCRIYRRAHVAVVLEVYLFN